MNITMNKELNTIVIEIEGPNPLDERRELIAKSVEHLTKLNENLENDSNSKIRNEGIFIKSMVGLLKIISKRLLPM